MHLHVTSTGKLLIFICVLAFSAFSNMCFANTWQNWVTEFKGSAITYGINEDFFDDTFSNITPNPKLLRFDKNQPEHRLTFLEYRDSRIDPYRIKLGRIMYKKNKLLLNQIASEYQVDPAIIVALWGMETSYGRFVGQFNVIRSLATLSYKSSRKKFFRHELLRALKILQEGHVSFENFVGEWAGASGQSQFLPSSWVNYAVDQDKDGKKDIWKTKADVFASIANYLVQHGWRANQPVLFTVQMPSQIYFDPNDIGLKNPKPLEFWEKMGITGIDYSQYSPNTQTYLVLPDGGPYLLVFKNFKVLMTYNNSTYYAASINYLAQNIASI